MSKNQNDPSNIFNNKYSDRIITTPKLLPFNTYHKENSLNKLSKNYFEVIAQTPKNYSLKIPFTNRRICQEMASISFKTKRPNSYNSCINVLSSSSQISKRKYLRYGSSISNKILPTKINSWLSKSLFKKNDIKKCENDNINFEIKGKRLSNKEFLLHNSLSNYSPNEITHLFNHNKINIATPTHPNSRVSTNNNCYLKDKLIMNNFCVFSNSKRIMIQSQHKLRRTAINNSSRIFFRHK